MEIKCKGCGRKPEEITEFITLAKIEGYESAEEAVKIDEGTYNKETGKFYCTECFIEIDNLSRETTGNMFTGTA